VLVGGGVWTRGFGGGSFGLGRGGGMVSLATLESVGGGVGTLGLG
jgi:hypothetical protein